MLFNGIYIKFWNQSTDCMCVCKRWTYDSTCVMTGIAILEFIYSRALYQVVFTLPPQKISSNYWLKIPRGCQGVLFPRDAPIAQLRRRRTWVLVPKLWGQLARRQPGYRRTFLCSYRFLYDQCLFTLSRLQTICIFLFIIFGFPWLWEIVWSRYEIASIKTAYDMHCNKDVKDSFNFIIRYN